MTSLIRWQHSQSCITGSRPQTTPCSSHSCWSRTSCASHTSRTHACPTSSTRTSLRSRSQETLYIRSKGCHLFLPVLVRWKTRIIYSSEVIGNFSVLSSKMATSWLITSKSNPRVKRLLMKGITLHPINTRNGWPIKVEAWLRASLQWASTLLTSQHTRTRALSLSSSKPTWTTKETSEKLRCAELSPARSKLSFRRSPILLQLIGSHTQLEGKAKPLEADKTPKFLLRMALTLRRSRRPR